MAKMDIWDKAKQPPSSALKKIAGGRLSGKTDINPQWRYQIMTEMFGPCGQGWQYEIKRLWQEAGPEGQIFAFAEVLVYVKVSDEIWSAPIPGIGGSMLIEKEKGGLYANDEAYKMATTDALGVAMKMLGVAADIYAGKWDGSKYIAEKPTEEKPTEKPAGKATAGPAKPTFAATMALERARVGDDAYYKIIGGAGYEDAEGILDRETQTAVYKAMTALPNKPKENA